MTWNNHKPEKAEVRSHAHMAYVRLRQRIIECDYAPGTRLRIASLASELSISPGAMREALSRLTSEHLVEARDQKGFRVAEISLAELDDLTETRVTIELLALKAAMENSTPGWHKNIRSAFEAMKSLDTNHRSPEASAIHEEFHNALVAASESPTLNRIRSSLYQASERYRHFALRTSSPSRDATSEHLAITDAILSNDVLLAKALLAAHIRKTATFVRSVIEQRNKRPREME